MMSSQQIFTTPITIFLVASEFKSFRRAAARLNVTPSTVSRAIKYLEEELGIELFARQRPMALTEEGSRLRKVLMQSQQSIDATIHDLQTHNYLKPNVAIGLPESINLRDGRALIEHLRPICSHIQLLSSGLSTVLKEWMIAHQLDLVVTTIDHDWPEGFFRIPILTERPLIVFPKKHVLPQGPVTWNSIRLTGLPLIGYSRCSAFEQVISALMQAENIPLEPLWDVDSSTVLFGLVEAGRGWALTYPSSLRKRDELKKTLHIFEPPSVLPERQLSVVFRKEHLRTIAEMIARFLNEVIESGTVSDGINF